MKEYVNKLLRKNGPDEADYDIIKNLLSEVEKHNNEATFRELISPVLNMNTLFGHSYLKPYGYAGDFMIIEKIYQKYVSTDSFYSKWDLFYHAVGAAKAVRNRKSYFIDKLEKIQKKEAPKVLILGSGPATDVYEYLSEYQYNNMQFHLLDFDNRAIDYAKKKNSWFLDKLTFITANALKFSTDEKYDFIWSAGLFDYFNDKVFVYLLKRYFKNLKRNGEMIIGNFSTANPSKPVMEVVVNWFLNYRDETMLADLACKAGMPQECISVEKEPLGINLFLRIRQ